MIEIVALSPGPHWGRLVAIPHAGAGIAALRPLATALEPRGVGIRAVRLPGRESLIDEPPIVHVERLAAELLSAIEASSPEPFALFGHSTGALFAFDLAHHLDAIGEPPTHLVVSGRPPPHLSDKPGHIHDLPPAQFLDAVEELVGERLPDLDIPQVWELVEPALRADMRMDETFVYEPGPPLSCPITALTGERSPSVPPATLLEWSRYTVGPFSAGVLPGGHFYVQTHAHDLAALLARHVVWGESPATVA